ncbi:hypothetical protein RO3G_05041 [Rhizopus delemar RA 99-880]|uniref:Uncharacterized protein n=1 Tax=Rhizopus delemar (strain RA 99-880 / ATCC MYA-4621 / FGSC 9543 / NRRL 43880) TaxID=246409 RepID=I1BVV6_RHIO9|nr:hypothetical protein RO3G_05041 [Rhizopus delemar RA 99-880]|eukprot:EIE80336.1 hypothetical protein RO3G_05041 [Rhizopus delemar RA 99-880]
MYKEDFSCDELDKDMAQVKLLSLYQNAQAIISESYITASFIHPFIQALFSSNLPFNIPHCSNISLIKSSTNSNKGLDYTVDIYDSYECSFTNVFGEIKTEEHSTPSAVLDFYRIASFTKEGLDKHKLNKALRFTTKVGYIDYLFMIADVHSFSAPTQTDVKFSRF